jgi:hypothetical protein
MSKSRGAVLAILFSAATTLVFVPVASAEIASSQITSPSSPTYGIYDEASPGVIAVSGSTSGGSSATDKIDLDCFYGSGPAEKTLASGVSLNPDGSFSVPAANLAKIESRVCRLRAVPAGATPANLSPFDGPVLALGRRRTETIETGPNTDTAYNYYVYDQQLSAADDFSSLGDCGLDDGYLFDSNFTETTTTFLCNDWFSSYDNFETKPSSTRSEMRIDGADAYPPTDAEHINGEASSGFPALSYTDNQDPVTGDLTIHESDPIVRCPDASYPPTEVTCPSFLGTGVRDDRTIVQSNDGHVVTITDQYVSTDGRAHALDLLPQNDQTFGESGGKIAYRFPGEATFATHGAGSNVAFSGETPGAIGIKVEGVPDGDTATGQGAIVFDRSAAPATFNFVKEGDSAFYLHQSATVPAGGSTTLRFAYVQGYTSAEVEALTQEAENSFKPPSISPPPAPPSNLFSFGKVKLDKRNGTAKLQVTFPGPGKLVLSGKKIKKAERGVTREGSLYVTIVPKGKLAHKLMRTGTGRASVRVAFTPTGGSTNTETTSLKLVRKR